MCYIESATIRNQSSVYCFYKRLERKQSPPDSVLLLRPKHCTHPKDLGLFLFHCFGLVFQSSFFVGVQTKVYETNCGEQKH